MTPLMMLALTLPPSLAFVIERWMAGREAQARKLSDADNRRLAALEAADNLTDDAFRQLSSEVQAHAAELKRLNEQLTILADRR